VPNYNDLLASQYGTCAFRSCGLKLDGAEKSLAVDHDHETGHARGLLCSAHNAGLGMLGDTPNGALDGLMYLLRAEGRHELAQAIHDIYTRSGTETPST